MDSQLTDDIGTSLMTRTTAMKLASVFGIDKGYKTKKKNGNSHEGNTGRSQHHDHKGFGEEWRLSLCLSMPAS